MSENLRILIVEDSERDAKLVVRQIKLSGFNPTFERVETSASFSDALEKGNFDIILSDYSMPGFTGLDALEIFKKTALDVPFIVISGTLGEEAAVEILLAGAHDFIVKGRWDRLIPAIKRELKECRVRLKSRDAQARIIKEQEKAQQYLDIVGVLIFSLDEEGIVTLINKKGCSILGYSENEVLGKNWFENFLPERYRKEVMGVYKKLMSGEVKPAEYYENPVLTSDGSEKIIAWHNSVIKDEDGLIKGIVSSGGDITDKIKAEETVREKTAYLESVLNSSADLAIAATDKDFRITYYNPVAEIIHGYTKEEVLGKTVMEMHTKENVNPKRFDRAVEIVKEKGEYKYEVIQDRKEGKRYLDMTISGIYDDEKELMGFLSVGQDVTDKKKAVEALKESEKRFRTLFEEAPISLWEEDFSAAKGCIDELYASGVEDLRVYCDAHPELLSKTISKVRIIDVNQKTLDLYKAKNKEELLSGLEETFTDESYRTFKEEILELAAGRVQFERESLTKTLAGETLNIIIRVAIVPGYEETWQRVLVSITDITEIKQAESALKKSEEKMQLITDTALDAIVMVDQNAIVLFWNPAAEKLFGYTREESIGSSLIDLIIPEKYIEKCKEGFSAFAKTGAGSLVGRTVEMTARKKDGSEFPMTHSINAIESDEGWKAVGIIHDITEMHRTREMLIQSAKLASIGELAANVAHEINNPMTAILGYSSLIMEDLEESDPLFEDMKTIEEESKRIKDIIRNLLDFSRQRKVERQLQNINEVLKSCVSLMEHTAKNNNVAIDLAINDELSPLEIDSNQIKQVFVNIIGNAIHAMPDGGQLAIATEISQENGGKAVLIKFKDSGCGIPVADMENIFHPFFSSKGEKGTGLGLSVSYGIIENHKGKILVESKEGEGAEFTVVLPVSE